MKKTFSTLLCLIVLSIAACTPMVRIQPDLTNPVYTVAVLPMYNATNDVEGPHMIREEFDRRIAKWHYQTRSIEEVDQLLRDRMGITLGSQLEMTTPQKLGEVLGVDGVVYGYLLNFDDITTGIYNVKKVRAGFKLVETRTGRIIWARGQGVKSELTSGGSIGSGVAALKGIGEKREGLEPFKAIKGVAGIPGLDDWHVMRSEREESIGDAAIMSIGGKLIGKALGIHLKAESVRMLDMIMPTLHPGPGGPPMVVASAPAVAVPEPQPPVMPEFTFPWYVELEGVDFSAVMVMTTVKVGGGKNHVFKGKIAKRGQDFRMDMDMKEMAKAWGGTGLPGLERVITIHKGREKVGYTIYPERKKYVVFKEVHDSEKEDVPKIEKKKVGKEVVDGHPCDKYRVKAMYKDGTIQEGYIWKARDLDGFVVKAEFENKGFKSIWEMRGVRLKTPPAVLFSVPKGYEEVSGMAELMGGER